MDYKYDKKDSYSLIPEGEYEVIIAKITPDETPTGKEKLSIKFQIREDVEQEAKKRFVFDTIWKEKDTDYYNRKRLNQLFGTQHFEDGKTFKTIEEVIEALSEATLRIKLVIRHNDYTDKDENAVAYYMSSTVKNQSITDTRIGATITEDDLPF